jgi:Family of unknown function (DUF6174)
MDVQGMAATVLLAASLGSLVSQQKTPAGALAEAEARWQARKPTAYEFTIEVRCECSGQGRRPTFRVAGTEAKPLQDLDAASRRFYDHYNTVEKLFAVIRRSLTAGGYSIQVRYDVELGYPTMADLDPQLMVKDDELSLRVTKFRKVEGAP